MKETRPRFLVGNPDGFTYIHLKIVTTIVEGKPYIFYKHEDGSTMLMPRDMYYEYIDDGYIPEPGKPEDIPGLDAGHNQ